MWFRKDKEKDPAPEPVSRDEALSKIKQFIGARSKVVPVSDLALDTKLFTSGLLDSLTFIQLVTFIESEFKFRLSDVTEVNADSLDTLDQIINIVISPHP